MCMTVYLARSTDSSDVHRIADGWAQLALVHHTAAQFTKALQLQTKACKLYSSVYGQKHAVVQSHLQVYKRMRSDALQEIEFINLNQKKKEATGTTTKSETAGATSIAENQK